MRFAAAEPEHHFLGTVERIREHPFWPSGADVVVEIDDRDTWNKVTYAWPKYRGIGDPTFRRDQLEIL